MQDRDSTEGPDIVRAAASKSDAIGIHAGISSALRFGGDRRFVGLSGWAYGALTLLDLATIGRAIGGHFGRDEAGTIHSASSPGIVFLKLRLFPFLWRAVSDGDLQIAASYQRSFVSLRLGLDEPPGFDMNTVRVLLRRALGPVDLDGGVGVIVGDKAADLRRYVEASVTVGLRLWGLGQPVTPDEQLKISAQGLYRSTLPGSGGVHEGYLLFGIEDAHPKRLRLRAGNRTAVLRRAGGWTAPGALQRLVGPALHEPCRGVASRQAANSARVHRSLLH